MNPQVPSPKSQNQNPTILRILNYQLPITNFRLAVLLGLFALVLYVKTLAPDVVDADGGEFQFAAWNFGFVHPTGYPLYLILGGLFQRIVPLGNPAYRLNLFTAFTASLAVAMMYLVVNELARHRGAAVIAAMSFALARMFWYDASAAETYDLNAFFIALLIYIALRWQTNPNAKTFAAFCFTSGLALTHHRTIILWIPAFVVFYIFVLRDRGSESLHASRRTYHVLRFTLFLLAPLLLYLYVPLRAPSSPYATLSLAPGRDLVLNDSSVTGFINYVLGRVFQSELSWDATSVTRLIAIPQLLVDQFGWIGVALGGIGFCVITFRREWARFGLLFTAFAVTVLFASAYHIGDIQHYYIPAYLVWVVWQGVAIAWLFEFIEHAPRTTHRIIRFTLYVLLLGVLFLQLISNLPFADRSGETMAREQWTRILASPIPQNAILISNDRDEMMPMWYMQYVENTRRDVLGLFPLITPEPEYANVVRLIDSVIDLKRPIFFIKPMQGLEIKYRFETQAPLVRVVGRASDTPPQFASDARIGERMRIVGYSAIRETGALHVAIDWQAQSMIDANYATFVHLLDVNGNKIAQGNDHLVGGEFYPTSMWQVGETLRDEYVIALPQSFEPGAYRLRVGMYRQQDGELLDEAVELPLTNYP